MIKKLRREIYLLPRGEQRAMVLVTLLLLLSLVFRLVVQWLPEKEAAGLEEFEREALAMMAEMTRIDSLEQVRVESMHAFRSNFWNASFAKSNCAQESAYRRIDLNRADSAQLLPLPGIGPVFAGRIIKYRKLLGGFLRVDQLTEVYGMPPETIELIRSRLIIDSSAVSQIRLDSATFKELLRHPYLEYEDVKALLEYRNFKRDISSIIELKENMILPDSILVKINGYFNFK